MHLQQAEKPAGDVATRRLTRIESVLVEAGVLSREALQAAKERQHGAKKPLVEVLLEQEAVEEELLISVLASATGMEVVPDFELVPDPDVQDLVPAEIAHRLGVLPLRVEEDVLIAATADPFQVVAFDELMGRTQLKVRPVLARPSAVRRALHRVRGGEEAMLEVVKNAAPLDEGFAIHEAQASTDGGPRALALDGLHEEAPTIRLVNLIIADAITRGASDIHLETEKSGLRVRFRIDGALEDVLNLPASAAAPVLSRVKIIAGLDIIENRRPQDGRAKVAHDRKTYDLRISTLPSYFGEKAVLRILDASAPSFSLDHCGFEPDLLATWRELIRRPNGMLLLTGPTGSGKTSTLYSSLLEIQDPKLNIVTVEDPVEYQFPGIVHVPVRSEIGMTFAAALRSILRQDPDIVLLGEIRDAETAQVAVQASMTGHLVLSTLHTNDAYGALPRLLDLGIEPSQLASCLIGVMAQRLARTVCNRCAEPAEVSGELLARLGWDPAGTEEAAGRRGKGCHDCRGTGLKGRTAIAELIRVTPALADLIATGASEAKLRRQIARDGTRSLAQSGLGKVLAGVSTPEEVLRVAFLDRDNPAPAAAAAKPIAASLRCPDCGEECRPNWRHCPACGSALEASTGPTALVCDDDRVSRELAIAALRKDFPVIHQAENGRQALDLIAVLKPDLLLIDMVMPGLMGIEVIRTLRANLETATLPIILLTASTDKVLEGATLDAGADDYLHKPITVAQLRSRAAALLRSKDA